MTHTKSANERRSSPRIQVNLPGEIQFDGRDPIPCRIRDLCQGGLLLECAATGQDLNCGPTTKTLVRFELSCGNKQSQIQTWIQVVQIEDVFLGAKFLHLKTSEMVLINAYLQAPCPIVAEVNAATSRVARTAQAILRRVTLRCLDNLTKPILDKMQAVLLMLSERAGSNAERSVLSDDLVQLARAIRQRRFQEQLRRELLDNILQQQVNSTESVMNQLSNDLTLVDKNEFELWLVISALAERLEQRLTKPLDAMRALSNGVFGDNIALSIEPRGLVKAMRQALAATGISKENQIQCLRVAAEPLFDPLGNYYITLTNSWAQSGFTPAALTRLRAVPATRTASAIKASPTLGPSQQQITANRSQRGRSGTKQAANNFAVSAAPISAEALSELLLMDNTDNNDIIGTGDILTRLTGLLAKRAPGSATTLPVLLDERVNVSNQMCSQMARDPAVPVAARKLLQQLTARVLAASVIESGFFTTAQHPMVEILDKIEHLAMFMLAGSGSKTPLQSKIDLLMQQAISAHPRDLPTLRKLSQQMSEVQQHLSEEWQRSIKQITTHCEHDEQIRAARRQVREVLNGTFADCLMHPVIIKLIKTAWYKLLQMSFIFDGGLGEKWQRHWAIIMDLHRVCSTGDQTIATERYSAILQAIPNGLRLTGLDPAQRAMLYEQIGDAMQATKTQASIQCLLFEPLPIDPRDVREEVLPAEHNTSPWIKALALVDALEIGTNLRLQQKNNQQHLRLVWRSRDGSDLVFVPPNTMKPKMISRLSLARILQSNEAQIQPLEQQTLVNRATDATLQGIQQRIQHHETLDAVTGLQNRRQLLGVLARLLTTSAPTFVDHVLGFMNLDQFHTTIDTYSHDAGQQLLVMAAQLLQNQFKKHTCLAYLGGSRFAFLIPIPSLEVAKYVGQQVCSNIAATPLRYREISLPHLSASIGLVYITAKVAATERSEALLSAADTACIAAQHDGGNQSVLFQEDHKNLFYNQKLMHAWIQAEEQGKEERLRLRGQRIAVTSSPDDIPHHYEILMSVYDEHGKQISLDPFIAAAEAFHLMANVDRLVLTKALEWVHDHLSQTRAFGGIAINLSGQSMGDNTLVDLVKKHLQRLDIPPKLISFEVTETSAIANLDQAAAIMDGIKAIGCNFALDDFGVGMSSYSYLKRLPVDYLKIDGSFIKNILSNPDDQIIVKSMNEVAHFMGKQTIAEYVENLQILERLQEMGIDYVQGYAIGKPQFLDEVQ